MKFKKQLLEESLNIKTSDKKTYSEKPQSIAITESQLERLIQRLNEQSDKEPKPPMVEPKTKEVELVDACKRNPEGKGCDSLFDRIKKFFVEKRKSFNFNSIHKVPPQLLSDYKKSCASYD